MNTQNLTAYKALSINYHVALRVSNMQTSEIQKRYYNALKENMYTLALQARKSMSQDERNYSTSLEYQREIANAVESILNVINDYTNN